MLTLNNEIKDNNNIIAPKSIVLGYQNVLVIGRSSNCDIQIMSKHKNMISREHAILLRLPSSKKVELVSKGRNGVLVNNKVIDTAILNDGDIIHFGGSGGRQVGSYIKDPTTILEYKYEKIDIIESPRKNYDDRSDTTRDDARSEMTNLTPLSTPPPTSPILNRSYKTTSNGSNGHSKIPEHLSDEDRSDLSYMNISMKSISTQTNNSLLLNEMNQNIFSWHEFLWSCVLTIVSCYVATVFNSTVDDWAKNLDIQQNHYEEIDIIIHNFGLPLLGYHFLPDIIVISLILICLVTILRKVDADEDYYAPFQRVRIYGHAVSMSAILRMTTIVATIGHQAPKCIHGVVPSAIAFNSGCFDMVFSGHTTLCVLSCWFIGYSVRSKPLKFLIAFWAIVGSLVNVLNGDHYTVDVLLGVYVSSLIFLVFRRSLDETYKPKLGPKAKYD